MSKAILEQIEWKVRAMKKHANKSLKIGLEIEELLLKLMPCREPTCKGGTVIIPHKCFR
jgi:hypothetical protein